MEPSQLATIGQLARDTGVATTTLRYYEREKLLPPTTRSAAGYRLYGPAARRRLAFILAARTVGFTLQDVRALIGLDETSPCAQVQALLQKRLTDVDRKLAELTRLRETLDHALSRCRRSGKGCPVLDDLNTRADSNT